MDINQSIVDAYVEYRAELIRFENRVVRDVLQVMLRGEEQAIGGIMNGYAKVLAKGDVSVWDGHGQRFHQNALDRVRKALEDVRPQAEAVLRKAIGDVAYDVQDEFISTLTQSLPKPVISELALSRVPERQLAIMLDSQFGSRLTGSAKLLNQAFSKINSQALARINAVMLDGVRDGVGMRRMQQLAKQALGAEDGVLGKDVASYVRTMVQTGANDAATMMYEENADIVRAEQYIATLDTDTCPICGPLDGQIFRLVDGKSTAPKPPRHPSCRCFLSPVLSDWKAMGLPDDVSKDVKRILNGKPATKTKWSDWVSANPERLERVLGPGRASLVQSGQVTLKDLASTTEVFSIVDLQKRRAA